MLNYIYSQEPRNAFIRIVVNLRLRNLLELGFRPLNWLISNTERNVNLETAAHVVLRDILDLLVKGKISDHISRE